MHVPRLRALLLGASVVFPLLVPLAAAAAPTLVLHDLVEQAWQRSAAGRSLPARESESEASRDLSASWLAGQPILGLSQRSDRWNGDRGLSESEISVASALWTPGQREARRALAERAARELREQTRKARLDIAGAVRTRLWDAAAAQALLEEKQGHLHHAVDLAEEVKGRVAAGDLARVDALLAEQEVQAGLVAVAQAKAEAQASAAKLQVLTGHAGPLPAEPEPLADMSAQAGADSPALLAARAAEQRAQAALRVAQASRNAPPTVTLSVRRERDIAMSAPDRSVGVAVQVPFGGAGRNRPFEAQAQAQLLVASAEAEQIEATGAAELEVARHALTHGRAALEAARARVAAMVEHRRLIERAFKLGERGLAELLRSSALAHEAEVALRQQEIALGRAHAQFNQAAGVLP